MPGVTAKLQHRELMTAKPHTRGTPGKKMKKLSAKKVQLISAGGFQCCVYGS